MPLRPEITLQPHQQMLADEASASAAAGDPFRKLLYWQVGAGKGPGSIAAAESLGSPYTAVVPAALRPTYRAELDRFSDQTIPAQVASYNAAATGKVVDPETMVVDEAQRLGSPGPQAAAVSNLAAKARNVILLSGTPIRNSPKEFAPIMSLLTGQPINQSQFADRYIGVERRRPGGILGWLRGEEVVEQPALTHTDELENLLAGKIDYYAPSKPVVGVDDQTHEVEMTSRQADLYRGFWDRLPFTLKWKLKHRYDLTPAELTRFRSFMTGPRQVALSDYPFRYDKDPLAAFHSSSKLQKAYGLLQQDLGADPRKKAVIFSNFPAAGLRPYSAKLTEDKVPHAIFDGTLSDAERKDMVDRFNKNELRVALIGPAASEGVSLKGAQVVQLLDPAWHDSRMRQAAARAIRFDSHHNLPPELQHVKIQRFVSKLPLGFKDRLLSSVGINRESQRAAVDDYLIAMSNRKERLNREFLDLLKNVSEENHHRLAKGAAALSLGDVLDAAEATLGVPDPGDRYLLAKLAELAPQAIDENPFRLIKQYSDLGTPQGYAEKTRLLRQAISKDPKSWVVDSVLNPEFVGVTHVGSGWRYHMRKRDVVDLLPPPKVLDTVPAVA